MYTEDDEFGPVTLPTTPSTKTFMFVKLGLVFGKLAILERSTDEPLQFVVPAEPLSAMDLTKYAETLAGWWESHFHQSHLRART